MRKAMIGLMLAGVAAGGCRESATERGGGRSSTPRLAPSAETKQASKGPALPAELSCWDISRIFILDLKDGKVEALTPGEWDTNPVWSPDGSRLAFANYDREGETWSLDVIGDDGSNRVRLVRATDTWGSRAVWSPDGSRIAAAAYRADRSEICILSPDGRKRTWLKGFGDDHDPRWSPDGSRIVFRASHHSRRHIYVMNAGGGGLMQLHKGGVNVPNPEEDCLAWSADGLWIAYVGRHRAGNGIYVMRSGGKENRKLVDTGQGEAFAWSPKGSKIAFVAGGDVHVIGAAASRSTRLTHTGDVLNQQGAVAWSPDGSRIVFVKREKAWGVWHLWVMRADGADQVQLTKGTHGAQDPVWSPDGSRIAFAAGWTQPPRYPPQPD